MTDQTPRPAILPFLIGDLLLLAAAGGIVYQSAWPLSLGHMALCTAAVALGAWLLVTPFIMQHRAALKLAETDILQSTVAQIQHLEEIKDRIVESTSAWTNIQGECSRTVTNAKEVADGMAAEARSFAEFMQKANDMEKATLRLEVDKLRRMEGEWLQVQVRTLDHVYALFLGGLQSGQTNLIEQLGQFQNACRDASRRMGLIPFAPAPGESYNPEIHQPADPDAPVPAESRIAHAIATGYNYQGRMLRPAIVLLASNTDRGAVEPAAPAPAAAAASAVPEAPEQLTESPVEFEPKEPTAPSSGEQAASANSSETVPGEAPANSASPAVTQAQFPI